MHYVYILKSLKDNKYYIGETKNVEKRLAYHNAGLQRSTKHRIPFVVIYVEQCVDEIAALKRENEIKNYKGGYHFKKLIEGM